MQENCFICPECGGTADEIHMMYVSPNRGTGSVWSGILQLSICPCCDYVIPRRLAERWNDMSIEQARREWLEEFRATAWKSGDEDDGDVDDE